MCGPPDAFIRQPWSRFFSEHAYSTLAGGPHPAALWRVQVAFPLCHSATDAAPRVRTLLCPFCSLCALFFNPHKNIRNRSQSQPHITVTEAQRLRTCPKYPSGDAGEPGLGPPCERTDGCLAVAFSL